jgi:hypothetical protein
MIRNSELENQSYRERWRIILERDMIYTYIKYIYLEERYYSIGNRGAVEMIG